MSDYTYASSIHPSFERPENFARTSAAGGWYCTVCTSPSLAHRFSLDARAAMQHEKSKAHRDRAHAFDTCWDLWRLPPDLAAWETQEETPYQDIIMKERDTDLSSPAHVKYRVRRWMKDCVLAEGGTWEDSEEDQEPQEIPFWEATPLNDWARSASSHHRQATPLPSWESGDVALTVDRTTSDPDVLPTDPVNAHPGRQDSVVSRNESFRFVEQIARNQGSDAKTKARMHAFFALPTQSKIDKIKEILKIFSKTNH